MIKLYPADAETMCKTILVGLPGVGKSTMADKLCAMFEQDAGIRLENVSSDQRLREVRCNKNNPVLKKFMQEHGIPDEDFPLIIKTTDFMKKYGEPCFRDLEADVIVDMLEKGEFKGKVPNLGGKAILHPRTAAAFKKFGYHIIYLKSDVGNVAQHVAKDFEKMLDGEVITRSNINDPIRKYLKERVPQIAELSLRRLTANMAAASRKRLAEGIKGKRLVLKRKKLEAQRNLFHERIQARDAKATEIMDRMYAQRNHGYETVADAVVKVSGNLESDLQTVVNVMRKNNISRKVQQTRASASRGSSAI